MARNRVFTQRDIDGIVTLIRDWPEETVKWGDVCAAAERVLGFKPSRQGLSQHEPILTAFQAKKGRLRIQPKAASPMPSSLAVASRRIASLMDELLMYRLLRHLPSGVQLILVGDPSQLPPIGPGLVLHALAGLPSIPQTELKVVQRQSSESGIPQVAAAIRSHLVPQWAAYQGKGSGVTFIQCPPVQLEERLQAIYEELGGDGCDYSVQILSITKADIGGVKNINTALHNRYRSNEEVVMCLDADYGTVAANTLDRIPLCVGDLVIFTENDYALGLRNGSLGKIIETLPVQGLAEPCCRCEFEGTEYLLNSSQIQALSHSYSITVHKSQGSQFKRVIIPIRRSRLLDQTLIYTAVTRGIKQVVLVGDLETAHAAILADASAARRNIELPRMLIAGHENAC